LEERGFFVDTQATAAYCYTALSLASTLNLGYLGEFLGQGLEGAGDWTPARDLVRDNRAVRFLREQGYSTVAFASEYQNVDMNTAEHYLAPWWFLNDFEWMWAGRTTLVWLLNKSGYPVLHDHHRKRVLYPLEHLPQAGSSSAPKFVFAHVLSPHPPFVFRADGQPLNSGRMYTWVAPPRFEYIRQYPEQIHFLNGKMKETITAILDGASTPPIIILQSDHGPYYGRGCESDSAPCVEKSFGVLGAIYLPDGGGKLYEGMNNANTFRVIFNSVFETRLEMLPSRLYSSAEKSPYDFSAPNSEECAYYPDP